MMTTRARCGSAVPPCASRLAPGGPGSVISLNLVEQPRVVRSGQPGGGSLVALHRPGPEVDVGRGGGTFVAEPKLEQDFTTLAGFSEQLRRYGLTPGALVLAAAEHQAGPASAAALQIAEDALVYGIRRIRLADGRPLVVEHSQFPAAVFPGMLECRLDGSLYELLEVKYGQLPHHARERLEPVTASVRETEALEVAEGAPLMLVERTAYSRTGQPLEFARDLFRGDRTRVVVWTSELAGEL
jgi:GntR family transcriptional regulator